MAGKSKEAVGAIYRRLEEAFGLQGWWPLVRRAGGAGYDREGYRTTAGLPRLDREERLEIAVGAILTQNTAWENARRAIEQLRGAELLSAKGLASLPMEGLAELIRPSGYFNQKARKLKLAAPVVDSLPAELRDPERARRQLLAVWGVGPETADSILLYAFRVPRFVVDAYARRIFSRVGLVGEGISYAALQGLLEGALPADIELFGEYHALIVRLGKLSCRPTPLCGGCPLLDACAFGRSRGSADAGGQAGGSPES